MTACEREEAEMHGLPPKPVVPVLVRTSDAPCMSSILHPSLDMRFC